MRREVADKFISLLLLLGSTLLSAGLILFVHRAFAQLNAPVDAYLIFHGIYLLVLAALLAKLISKLLEV